jgi:ribulose-5-phosphate 4-epimerase/fuculose-1-phosphate aldolase
MSNEGSVKYRALHTAGPPLHTADPAIGQEVLERLNTTRTLLHDLGLIGVLPNGVGYGNLSIRHKENEFIISGTGTGAERILTLDKYCLVTAFDIDGNSVTSCGPVRASAESMTHGVIYRALQTVNCVIHVHSRRIFDGMLRGNYPATPPEAAYGTPEIARETMKAVSSAKRSEGVIVLAGHDEGVVAYGADMDRTFNLVRELYYTFCEKAQQSATNC